MSWLEFLGVMVAALIGSALGPYLVSRFTWGREVRRERMSWRLQILREVNDLLAERYRRLEAFSSSMGNWRNEGAAKGLHAPKADEMVDTEEQFQIRQKLRATINSEFGQEHGKRFDAICSNPLVRIMTDHWDSKDPWLSWHTKYHEEWRILLTEITGETFR